MLIRTTSEKIFNVGNYIFIVIVCLSCILPIIHVLAISFSSPHYAAAGRINLLPMGFTVEAYRFTFEAGAFVRAFWVSIQRTVLGLAINMVFIVLAAYPLSKPSSRFGTRNIYMVFFAITMIFGGGLIPFFILMNNLGLIDTMWALVLPTALPVFSMLILMNFIRNLPSELEEAALMDGAGYVTVLVKILLPVLKPSLATVALFSVVFHWNEWFHGMILINDPANVPLQTYLRALMESFAAILRQAGADPSDIVGRLNEHTGRAAQLFLAMVPMLIVYPFLQKYFARGLVIGSVKG